MRAIFDGEARRFPRCTWLLAQGLPGRQFAEYMLRAPFSLEKSIGTKRPNNSSTVPWHTKQNYQIYSAADFIAATVVEHIPPKGQQTVPPLTPTNVGVGTRKTGFNPHYHRQQPVGEKPKPELHEKLLVHAAGADPEKEIRPKTRLEITDSANLGR